jgi:uncharacterized protein (DUF608 family)
MNDETKRIELEERSDRRIIRGEALRAVAMPLGGIGAGQIALAGDGGWRQWQIMNVPNHLGHVPYSFFAARIRPEAAHFTERKNPEEVMGVARVLMSPALYDDAGFTPPVTSTDHMVPEESRRLLALLPGVAEIEYTGEYPIATVTYRDPALSLPVRLESYSPFAPLDEEMSGYPAIVCTLSLLNTGDSSVYISLAATLQNAVGWDGKGRIHGARFGGYGGNVNRVIRSNEFTSVEMSNTRIGPDHERFGQMALSALDSDVTWLGRWDSPETFWADFTTDGRLDCIDDAAPSDHGNTVNAALCRSGWVKPGEEFRVTYVISWYFPNQFIHWDQQGFGLHDKKSRFFLGTHYATKFSGAFDVACHVKKHFSDLDERTKKFRKVFYDSTLPYWLLDAISSQTSIIRSPTCMWLEDGEFHGFEGCHGASTGSAEDTGGCCPLNCNHVWNYEQALARLFPRLEQAMRRTDLKHQMSEEGRIGHRTLLPLYLPRWTEPATDGQLGTILKLYRDFRASGDREFLDGLLPNAKKALEWIFTHHDSDRDGILDGYQPNTYDCAVHGHNTFITSLYLAALRAMEEMAKTTGDNQLAEECRSRFEVGRTKIDGECWNGEYFVQKPEPEKSMEMQYGTGCHVDQVFGQWWAHILDLGPILPKEHVRTALQSIVRHNWREDFAGFKQTPRIFASDHDSGLLICTWPQGGKPEKPTLYSDEVWPGTDYEVAGSLLFEGLVDDAFKVIQGTRKRYDGTQRNPWNEVECGDHYVRSMASWTLLEAASGYRYNAGKHSIGFGPRVTPTAFRAPFVAAEAWGTFDQRLAEGIVRAQVTPQWGNLKIAVFELDVPGGAAVVGRVLLNGKPVRCTSSTEGRRARIGFPDLLTLGEGDTLSADVRVVE